ncbi:MAG: hypothetical protein HeimAB125_09380 [Candidatus Heimdallarchaeota archaeon AB_125]|nr:MAG: hypothetical protein HeimAB125_09380 [Candidatus Heimdallarchaeota archaeon AB_125]
MHSHQILPSNEQTEKEVVLLHKNGEIISINKSIYQVRIYKEPNRKIFTTSIERAYQILKKNDYDYSEADFYFDDKNE